MRTVPIMLCALLALSCGERTPVEVLDERTPLERFDDVTHHYERALPEWENVTRDVGYRQINTFKILDVVPAVVGESGSLEIHMRSTSVAELEDEEKLLDHHRELHPDESDERIREHIAELLETEVEEGTLILEFRYLDDTWSLVKFTATDPDESARAEIEGEQLQLLRESGFPFYPPEE
jgi:hypothetical protein